MFLRQLVEPHITSLSPSLIVVRRIQGRNEPNMCHMHIFLESSQALKFELNLHQHILLEFGDMTRGTLSPV